MEKAGLDRSHEGNTSISPKLNAFLELEQMVEPVPELDCEKELREAREERNGERRVIKVVFA